LVKKKRKGRTWRDEVYGKFHKEHLDSVLKQVQIRKELLSEMRIEFSKGYFTPRGRDKLKEVEKLYTKNRRLLLSFIKLVNLHGIIRGDVFLGMLLLGHALAAVDELYRDQKQYISSKFAGGKPGKRTKIPFRYHCDIIEELLPKESANGLRAKSNNPSENRELKLAPTLRRRWEHQPLPEGLRKLPALNTVKSWIRLCLNELK
jgi:hypothetical protein